MRGTILIFLFITQAALAQPITRKDIFDKWTSAVDFDKGRKLLFVVNGVFYPETDTLKLDEVLSKLAVKDIKSIDFVKCTELQFCNTGNDIAIVNTGKKRGRKTEKLSIVH